MSFADLINQERKNLESQGGNNDKVGYPETKHKRLFFEKGQREILVQVLPSADLRSAFAVPVRKVFLTAKSSQGKDINSNFTLDADQNPGSLLEQKIVEWASKNMIPNGFGGQTAPSRKYLVNAVKVIQNPANPQQWVQERDEQGQLVVRVLELPQSAYSNIITKLGDPLLNSSGTELSFMDINKPAPIKISKPGTNQKEYPVEVYSMIPLPPLGQGWETQLEDLNAQAVPTERLENGAQWVQAFVDMKEGRKPNQNGGQAQPQPTAPATNPYANIGQPVGQPTETMPTYQPQGQPAPMPGYAPTGQPTPMPTYPTQPVAPTQPVITMPTGMESGPAPTQPQSDPFHIPETDLSQNGGLGAPVTTAPTYTAPAVPETPTAPVMPTPSHNTGGLPNIEDLLKAELGN